VGAPFVGSGGRPAGLQGARPEPLALAAKQLRLTPRDRAPDRLDPNTRQTYKAWVHTPDPKAFALGGALESHVAWVVVPLWR